MHSLSAFAGEPPLRLDLSFRAVRTGAPILVQAKLTVGGNRLLEGRLELVVMSAGRVVATCRTHEMALSSGEKVFDVLLPVCWSGLRDNELEVYPRFLTERGAVKLPRLLRSLPETWERSCVVAVCGPRERLGDGGDQMAGHLGLEQFRPKLPEGSRKALMTSPVAMTPDDLPSQPLAYCAFDLLLLADRSFASLRQAQLDAVARWVRAGGSVCVVASGVVGSGHVQCLNELADRDTPLFRLDAGGRLQATEPPHVRGGCDAYLLRPCLGRAVVITAQPPRGHDYKLCPQWRRILAFLWKVRAQQLPGVLKDGRWRSDQEADAAPGERAPSWEGENVPAGYRDADLEMRLGPQPFGYLPEIVRGLMPTDVQRVSFAAIVLVLLLFILLIGPVDYFLLGLLRIRKFTWLFLPIVAGLFTYFMVRLSEYYMGMRDRRRAVVFVDVDRKGRPVRQTRFELLFPGRERLVSVALKSAVLHCVDCATLTQRDEDYPYRIAQSRRQLDFVEGAEAMPLAYEGSVLGQCTVTHKVRQWSPVLYRSFSLEPPEHVADIQWDAVSDRDLLSATDPHEVGAKLFRGRREAADVFLLRLGRCDALARKSGGRLLLGPRPPRFFAAHPRVGLFSIVSQISPTGATHTEDLSVHDPTDGAEWLLIVVEEVGDDLYVYRRLYRGEQ
ncbi:MAG TPA: hypothetical protein VNE39_27620 [Planctomycetota bacterium]|nr:hypothetical protein [Planctomycetota bacterium]